MLGRSRPPCESLGSAVRPRRGHSRRSRSRSRRHRSGPSRWSSTIPP